MTRETMFVVCPFLIVWLVVDGSLFLHCCRLDRLPLQVSGNGRPDHGHQEGRIHRGVRGTVLKLESMREYCSLEFVALSLSLFRSLSLSLGGHRVRKETGR